MALATVPGVYAAALLDLATERGSDQQVVADARELAKGLTQEMLQALDDPRVGKARMKQILMQVAEGAHELVLRLLLVLVDRNRLREAPAILAEVVQQADDRKGIIHVDVTTAIAMQSDTRQRVLDAIKGIHGAEAVISEHVDASLIGGFTARIGDNFLDASVRRRLSSISDSMHQADVSSRLWAAT